MRPGMILLACLALAGCNANKPVTAETAETAETDQPLKRMAVTASGVTQEALVFDPTPDDAEKALWLIVPDTDTSARDVLSRGTFQAGARDDNRMLVILEVTDATTSATAEITLASLFQEGRTDLSDVYLIGIGSGSAVVLGLAPSNYLSPRGIAVVSGEAVETPGAVPRGITTTFLAGGAAPSAVRDANEQMAAQWSAAMACGTSVSGTANGIRQRGYYGCKDGATVLFGIVEGFEDIGPDSNLNLSFLIDSYFKAYVR